MYFKGHYCVFCPTVIFEFSSVMYAYMLKGGKGS